MQAVVLVGGEGTRLRPLTWSIPKAMLPIVEVPMIERVLGQLAVYGIEEAVLSLGYLPRPFQEAYPDGTAAGVRLTYAVEPVPLDTAGAIRFAADHAGIDETFVVVNGDVLTDMDLGALVAFHRRRGAEGTISLHPVTDPSAYGVVPTDPAGRVTAFVEKPDPGAAPSDRINAGTYVLEPSVLDRIAAGRRVSVERETFPAMVEDGTLYASCDDAYWLDTGTPQAYLTAHWDLLEGRRNVRVPVPGANARDPGVWVLDTPRIDGTVRPSSFVGPGAVVEDGAGVFRSVVGRDCVIEEGASVSSSVLLAGARVASGAVVEGSVLGPGSVVGEGSDVRPISVIAGGALIAPGSVVTGERVSS